MTRSSLSPRQRRLLEIVEGLSFGAIQGLVIRDGEPSYNPAPKTVQLIKLGSPTEIPRSGDAETLKKAFTDLFDHLSNLHDGTVDIEVQHRLPFRLIVQRDCGESA